MFVERIERDQVGGKLKISCSRKMDKEAELP